MIRIMERNALASHLVSELIPEFDDPYPVSEYQQRCSSAVHLSLIAEIEHQPAGFKILLQLDGRSVAEIQKSRSSRSPC